MAALCVVGVQPAIAAESDCRNYPSLGRGLHVQTFDNTDVTGGIAGLPDRVTTNLAPGQRGRVCVGFQNRTGREVTLRFATHDFGAGRNGAPAPFAIGEESYGAGSWLALPSAKQATIPHGDLVWLDVKVDVPIDTAGGSAYAGVSASLVDARTSGGKGGVQTRITPSVVVQVFFDVPGDVTSSGRLEAVQSTRVVWWDGLDIGKVPVLDRFRGRGIAPVRFKWRNDGSVTDDVGATLTIASSLGGKEVASIDVPERLVLRDAGRSYETAWSRDIPFIGRFKPTLRVERADGTIVERNLPAIWVIPSWWYIALVVLAIGIPVAGTIRRRRRHRELLTRLEQAEAWADRDDGSWGE